MTFEELNSVRNLRKQMDKKLEFIQALELVAEDTTTKYKREKNGKETFTALDVSPHGNFARSKTDEIVPLIIDAKHELVQLQTQYDSAKISLIKKIQAEFTDTTEQNILIYRYVACCSIRNIAKKMMYSPVHIYKIQQKILKKVSR